MTYISVWLLCIMYYNIEVSFKLNIFHSYRNVLLTYYNGRFWLFGITMKVWIEMSVEHQWFVLGSRYSAFFFFLLYFHPQLIYLLFDYFHFDTMVSISIDNIHINLLVSQMFHSHIIIWFSLCMLSVCTCAIQTHTVYTYESVKSIWIIINNIFHESSTYYDVFRILFAYE